MTESVSQSTTDQESNGITELPPEAMPSSGESRNERKPKDSVFSRAVIGYARFLSRFSRKVKISKKIPSGVSDKEMNESGSIYTRIPPLDIERYEQVGFY